MQEKISRVLKYNKYYNNERFTQWFASFPYSIFLSLVDRIQPSNEAYEMLNSFYQRGKDYQPNDAQSAMHTFAKPALFLVANEATSALAQTETVKKVLHVVPEQYRDFVDKNGQIALAAGASEVAYAVGNGLSQGTALQDLQQQPRRLVKKVIIHNSTEAAFKLTDFAVDKGLEAVGYSGEGWTKSGLKFGTKIFLASQIARTVNTRL